MPCRRFSGSYPSLVARWSASSPATTADPGSTHLTAAGCRVADGTERAGSWSSTCTRSRTRRTSRCLAATSAARLADGGLLVLEFHHLLPLVTATNTTRSGTVTGPTSR